MSYLGSGLLFTPQLSDLGPVVYFCVPQLPVLMGALILPDLSGARELVSQLPQEISMCSCPPPPPSEGGGRAKEYLNTRI